MIRRIGLLLTLVLLSACQNEHHNLADGLYADIETSKGNITVELEFEKTPITVANFVSLAEGKNAFVSPQYKGKPLYDGLKFHRVEPNFVIQGGDPLGDGTGDAGYRFRDEIVEGLQFDKGGLLAMANSGPGTNGTQFFITHVPTPFLNGRHTIFGHVADEASMDVVNQIEPGDEIVSVKIIRKGEAAKKFNAAKVFSDFFKQEAEIQKKQAAIEAEAKRAHEAKYKAVKDAKVAEWAEIKKTAKTTRSGLKYVMLAKGNGKPNKGDVLQLNYSGWLENGHLVDSNVAAVAEKFGKYNERDAQYGKYRSIEFPAGRKDGMIPGFIEGIEALQYGGKILVFIPSNLAFGPQGAGGEVPPNANMIFEIELVSTK
ncbi:peptidylprolyl isomerase [Flavobacterium caeni]|uniref:peptidylprolyl isomerase n=1 Tax=Flavobacterium caeni TaxID=490189 RepID=A0A1G5JJE4_9FLAO|nr:peptidylprolyl isomerase [Flavobacterium caeni]SCY88503.1 peptidylprolyl isomerase [Flavobacterium caeni]